MVRGRALLLGGRLRLTQAIAILMPAILHLNPAVEPRGANTPIAAKLEGFPKTQSIELAKRGGRKTDRQGAVQPGL